MKINYIISYLLFTTFCFPQIDTTKKDFYPLEIGNLWQYRNESNLISTEKIIGDTVLDGFYYYNLVNISNIFSIVPKRIDYLLRVISRYGGPFWGDTCGGNTPYEASIFHLNETDSTVWKICNGLYLEQFVRFNGTRIMNIFGQPREVIEFDYGGIGDFGDTIWFYGARLAKGIGIIEEQHYEGNYYILQGAVIKGIQYGTIVSIDDNTELIPTQIVLHQNYPNPFNPSTKISWQSPIAGQQTLKVYDVLGNEVATLVNEFRNAGSYEVDFDASKLSSGVYFYKLQAGDFVQTKKMILMK
jgi:hypothetical protein